MKKRIDLEVMVSMLLLFFLLSGCKDVTKGTPNELLNEKFETIDTEYLLVNPGSINECDRVKYNDIDFSICYKDESSQEIEYIFTSDTNYSTREGIRVGHHYSDVSIQSKSELRHIQGWGYVLDLPSGWNAVFDIASEPSDQSKVMSIFYHDPS